MTPRKQLSPGIFATVGKQQLTPRIITGGQFDSVEATFKGWVSGSPSGRRNLWKAWTAIDYNGNGIVSLAEIDKWVVENFAQSLNNKSALMRAYKASTSRETDGYVHKIEFPVLLRNIVYFNKLWSVFALIDSDDDRRLTFAEFRAGLGKLGLVNHDAHAVFDRLDTNKGGLVLFEEFCKWVATEQCPVDHTVYDPVAAGNNLIAVMGHGENHMHGHAVATTNAMVEPTHLRTAQFDGLEAKFKVFLKSTRQLHDEWRRLDYNGNGFVSLAEIDKLVEEHWPLLNNKPALMRAYKATIRGGDSYVHKGEFKHLLRNLLYFNKAWAIFAGLDTDSDRRLDFTEFRNAGAQLGLRLPPAEAREEFDFIDTNGGGMVLFDEFCKWVASKKLPID